MILKELTAEHPDFARICKLYDESFPESERILSMQEMMALGESQTIKLLGIYTEEDPDTLAGFFLMAELDTLAYLWFFATCPEMRSKGIGSKAIQALKERYTNKPIAFDYESVFEECDNMEQRERRRAFYLKNGYHETGWFMKLNGVELIIASSAKDFDINDYLTMVAMIAELASDGIEGMEEPEVYRR